jgi:hypothetical protein
MKNKRQIVEILHTIFCRKQHEIDMLKIDASEKCCYYLEQTLENPWAGKSHKTWLEWGETFHALSRENSIDMLEHIMHIYTAAEALRKANPLYLKFVQALIGEENENRKS